MMRASALLLIFSIIAATFFFSGCYEVENEIAGISINNPADSATGKSLIEVDSIASSTDEIEFFFHVKWDHIKDSSKAHRIRVHRSKSYFSDKELSPGEFDYFIDINVRPSTTYTYQFEILTEDRMASKLSKKYKVRSD